MKWKKISRFPVPTFDEMPEDIKQICLGVKEHFGFIPNVVTALAHHSGHNGCAYCVASHGAALRLASGNSALSDQVAMNYREADITPRQKAMIDFAMKVTNDSRSINEEDFEILREHGFSDEDIWDIAGLTAFYNMSNRLMSFLAVCPDEEFYKLGH